MVEIKVYDDGKSKFQSFDANLEIDVQHIYGCSELEVLDEMIPKIDLLIEELKKAKEGCIEKTQKVKCRPTEMLGDYFMCKTCNEVIKDWSPGECIGKDGKIEFCEYENRLD